MIESAHAEQVIAQLQLIRDELTRSSVLRPVYRQQVRLARTVDDGSYPNGNTPGQTEYPIIFLNRDVSDRQTATRAKATNLGNMYLQVGTRTHVVLVQGKWFTEQWCCGVSTMWPASSTDVLASSTEDLASGKVAP